MHINSLELLAATLAVKTFMKDVSGTSVLLQLDNATAVAYINNMGGTVLTQLTELAKELWLWALKDICLGAQHIPGVFNTKADASLKLCGIAQIVCSALIYSVQSTLAEAVDAFQQDWGPLRGFANPPWCFIGRVLSQARRQQAQLVLVAPVWRGQTWYPVLLEMLWDFPRLIAPVEINRLPDGDGPSTSHVACLWQRFSGNSLSERLLSSFFGHGEPNQHSHMTRTSESGLAGVPQAGWQ